jgi:ATP-dependent DNA ligase
MLRTLSPTVAIGGPQPTPGDACAFEPKLDGWRVLVYVDHDLDVCKRTGRSIAGSVPGLSPLPGALAARRKVLDRELVAGQGVLTRSIGSRPRVTAQTPAWLPHRARLRHEGPSRVTI